jgi:hypothetical protein
LMYSCFRKSFSKYHQHMNRKYVGGKFKVW